MWLIELGSVRSAGRHEAQCAGHLCVPVRPSHALLDADQLLPFEAHARRVKVCKRAFDERLGDPRMYLNLQQGHYLLALRYRYLLIHVQHHTVHQKFSALVPADRRETAYAATLKWPKRAANPEE